MKAWDIRQGFGKPMFVNKWYVHTASVRMSRYILRSVALMQESQLFSLIPMSSTW